MYYKGLAKREDLFVTGKLWGTEHAKDRVEAACRKYHLSKLYSKQGRKRPLDTPERKTEKERERRREIERKRERVKGRR